MSNPFIGEIRMFGGNFAPQGWAFCGGQIMAIDQNPTLYTLIGTTYGGDGQSTFGLPDLQGRIPLHQGSGFIIGQFAGTEEVTLATNNLPSHGHSLGVAGGAVSESPLNARFASSPTGSETYAASGAGPIVQAAAQATPLSGGSNQPHENMMPFLTVSFIISLFGIFPSQN